MKNISIGDEHGRGKFLRIYNKIKDDKDINKIYCTGDYVSPYEPFTHEDLTSNMLAIIDIAKKDSRVQLLLGNHDLEYIIIDPSNRFDGEYVVEFRKILMDNWSLFKLAEQVDKDTCISHAGISSKWMNDFNLKSIDDINALTKSTKEMQKCLQFSFKDNSSNGNSIYQGCTWIRPQAIIAYEDNWFSKNQIIGHTRTDIAATIPEMKASILAKNPDWDFESTKTLSTKDGQHTLYMVDTGDFDTYLEKDAD